MGIWVIGLLTCLRSPPDPPSRPQNCQLFGIAGAQIGDEVLVRIQGLSSIGSGVGLGLRVWGLGFRASGLRFAGVGAGVRLLGDCRAIHMPIRDAYAQTTTKTCKDLSNFKL